MTKKAKPEIPFDMWLRVATDALSRYVAGGGNVMVATTADGGGIVITLPDVAIDDPRLALGDMVEVDA